VGQPVIGEPDDEDAALAEGRIAAPVPFPVDAGNVTVTPVQFEAPGRVAL
jgi:hypothetical protein